MNLKLFATNFKNWSIYLLGILSLLIFFWGGIFPDGRNWGINFWAYIPGCSPVLFFEISAIVLTLLFIVFPFNESLEKSVPPQTSLSSGNVLTVLVTAAIGVAIFWVFRSETHFFGDGYLLLSHIDSSSQFMKWTEIGETLLHHIVYSLVSGQNYSAGLLTYQSLSVTAGFVFLIATGLSAYKLFADLKRRLLFFLGMACGGYVLLFFGYVEHYSWVILSSAIFILTGILHLKGKLTKWPVLVSYLFAVIFHLIAITLTPALLYILLRGTPLSHQLKSRRNFILLLLLTVSIALFFFLYKTNYFFRFMFVPLVPIEITVENYTLFSFPHLIDYLNLITLLFPGIIILIWFFLKSRRSTRHSPEYTFLNLLILTTIFCTFVLDPKLGMPRDWDLFCIAGLPLSIFFYYSVLEYKPGRSIGSVAAVVSILLSLSVLIPRIVALNKPETAIAHLKNYMELDRAKSRAAGQVLYDYYKSNGDSTSAAIEKQRWDTAYPEMKLVLQSGAYLDRGDDARAAAMTLQAINRNPLLWNANANYSITLMHRGMNDSALKVLKVADAINPDNPVVQINLGHAWKRTGHLDNAEKCWRSAFELDSSRTDALSLLLELYKDTGIKDKWMNTLRVISRQPDVPVKTFVLMMQYYINDKQFDSASDLYRSVLSNRSDTIVINQLIEKNPEFRNYLDLD